MQTFSYDTKRHLGEVGGKKVGYYEASFGAVVGVDGYAATPGGWTQVTAEQAESWEMLEWWQAHRTEFFQLMIRSGLLPDGHYPEPIATSDFDRYPLMTIRVEDDHVQ